MDPNKELPFLDPLQSSCLPIIYRKNISIADLDVTRSIKFLSYTKIGFKKSK